MQEDGDRWLLRQLGLVIVNRTSLRFTTCQQRNFRLLREACVYDRPKILRALLDHPDIDPQAEGNVLEHPCAFGNLFMVRLLLAHHGTDVNNRISESCVDGRSALDCACEYGQVRVVAELLRHPGIRVDMCDVSGCLMPLYWAVRRRNNALTDMLQRAGADPRLVKHVDDADREYVWGRAKRLIVVRWVLAKRKLRALLQSHFT